MKFFKEFIKKILNKNSPPIARKESKDQAALIQEEESNIMENRKKVALSACLYGVRCRYDGTDNKDVKLLNLLHFYGYEIVLFCPEDDCFGTPRPTMDLIQTDEGIKAISNLTGADLTPHIKEYAIEFFKDNSDIELFIGKDRSPSCGVRSARIYDREKNLIKKDGSGIMAEVAKKYVNECKDAEEYLQIQESRLNRNQKDL